MQRFFLRSFAVAFVGLTTVPALAQRDIVDTAVGAGQFQTLVKAVQAANLVGTLKGKGPFTVFAPTDEAFGKLPKKTLRSLLRPENRDQLAAILTYHVVPGRVMARDAFGLDAAGTVNGQRLDLDFGAAGLKVDNAKVVKADIECSNGVIHVIDTVMLPSSKTIPGVAAKAGQFQTLLAAAKAAGLVDALSGKGPLTVFAPTDEAFAALPKGTVPALLKPENRQKLADILKLHVVQGRVFATDAIRAGKARTLAGQDVTISLGAEGARVNESRLVATDIDAANGVIHVIDRVLLPQTIARVDAVRILEDAVDQGAPEFNRGNFRRCVAAYADACKRIVDSAGEEIDATTVGVLELTLERIRQIKSDRDRAWALRAGIDLAYFALNRRASLAAGGGH